MMERGTLRIYLGAAPGVGKTYAMLAEGQRRARRGTDVVIGFVEPHGRTLTAAMAEGLETVPRRDVVHHGAVFTEMDVAAVLARSPQVALIDELAHTNLGAGGHEKRWQDVEDLLAAGIDVVTTLNIQHLESLSDVVAQITGAEQRERIPDTVARRAEQVELVDMTPQALRRRMVHGNIYPADRIEAALTHYFRPGNLTALRELALLWVADRVEEGLQNYRAEHGIAAPWETRERVVIALSGGPEGETLIRRAGRIAERTPGTELLAVHVSAGDGLVRADPSTLGHQRALTESLGGSYHTVVGEDIAETVLRFARAQNATQMVLGTSRRGRLMSLLAGESVGPRVIRHSGHIDVHLVTHAAAADSRPRGRRSAFRRWGLRRWGRHALGPRAEAAAVSSIAAAVVRGRDDPPSLVEQVRESLGLDAVSLLERLAADTAPSAGWYVTASSGDMPPEHPDDADAIASVHDAAVLAARGKVAGAAGHRVLAVCAEYIDAALDRRRRRQSAESYTALSPDGPLASVRLVIDRDLAPSLVEARDLVARRLERAKPADALLEGALDAVDRSARVVADLADLCRLRAGAIDVHLRPVELDEALEAALADLGPTGHDLVLAVPEDLPDAIADAAQLTRVITMLAADALAHEGDGRPPVISAARRGAWIEIRVNAPGPRTRENGAARSPARLAADGSGPDLSVRLSHDLAEAMGGSLTDTPAPDGRHEVTLRLPAAR
jgi:two-component system sensor histidine kinase KdpD